MQYLNSLAMAVLVSPLYLTDRREGITKYITAAKFVLYQVIVLILSDTCSSAFITLFYHDI